MQTFTNNVIIHKNLLKNIRSRYQFHFIFKMEISQLEFKHKENIDTTCALGKLTETHP